MKHFKRKIIVGVAAIVIMLSSMSALAVGVEITLGYPGLFGIGGHSATSTGWDCTQTRATITMGANNVVADSGWKNSTSARTSYGPQPLMGIAYARGSGEVSVGRLFY